MQEQETQTISNETAETIETFEAELKKQKLLKAQQEAWIDFNAVGGLLLEADGSLKMSPTRTYKDGRRKTYSVRDFANEINVDISLLYKWEKSIPSFWDLVAKRRKEIFSGRRVAKVWNGVFLKAASGEAKAAAIFLSNYDPNFKLPGQPDPGDDKDQPSAWSALLAKKRDRLTIRSQQAKEGEIVDASNQQPVANQ
jgi:hypothetical protein